jgi:hypothetical protein
MGSTGARQPAIEQKVILRDLPEEVPRLPDQAPHLPPHLPRALPALQATVRFHRQESHSFRNVTDACGHDPVRYCLFVTQDAGGGVRTESRLIASLPAPLPGSVRVVCVSDTHDRLQHLGIPPGDVLVHAGAWIGNRAVFQATLILLSYACSVVSRMARLKHQTFNEAGRVSVWFCRRHRLQGRESDQAGLRASEPLPGHPAAPPQGPILFPSPATFLRLLGPGSYDCPP